MGAIKTIFIQNRVNNGVIVAFLRGKYVFACNFQPDLASEGEQGKAKPSDWLFFEQRKPPPAYICKPITAQPNTNVNIRMVVSLG